MGWGAGTSKGVKLHTQACQFAFQSELELLNILLGRAIPLLSGNQPEPSHLVEVPIGDLTIAETDVSADQSAGSGDLIHCQ